MSEILVTCPDCGGSHIVKNGKQPNGEQRYLCRSPECSRTNFLLHYQALGWLPETKEKILEMAMNGSGIRDTARVLHISQGTVIDTIKKKRIL